MKIKGEDIKRLIPQREPFIMVDEFQQTADASATTALTIGRGTYFLLPDGTMAETGLVEHMAQSAAALAGVSASTPRIGLIGEVKRFECLRRPMSGETVETQVTFGFSFGNVSVVRAESRVGSETIATAQMKIFIQDP